MKRAYPLLVFLIIFSVFSAGCLGGQDSWDFNQNAKIPPADSSWNMDFENLVDGKFTVSNLLDNAIETSITATGLEPDTLYGAILSVDTGSDSFGYTRDYNYPIYTDSAGELNQKVYVPIRYIRLSENSSTSTIAKIELNCGDAGIITKNVPLEYSSIRSDVETYKVIVYNPEQAFFEIRSLGGALASSSNLYYTIYLQKGTYWAVTENNNVSFSVNGETFVSITNTAPSTYDRFGISTTGNVGAVFWISLMLVLLVGIVIFVKWDVIYPKLKKLGGKK